MSGHLKTPQTTSKTILTGFLSKNTRTLKESLFTGYRTLGTLHLLQRAEMILCHRRDWFLYYMVLIWFNFSWRFFIYCLMSL